MHMKGIKLIVFSILLQPFLKSTARAGNYEANHVVAAGSSLGLSLACTRHPQSTKLFLSLIIDNTITMIYMLSATP